MGQSKFPAHVQRGQLNQLDEAIKASSPCSGGGGAKPARWGNQGFQAIFRNIVRPTLTIADSLCRQKCRGLHSQLSIIYVREQQGGECTFYLGPPRLPAHVQKYSTRGQPHSRHSSLAPASSLWARDHIDYIAQGPKADEAWATFILNNSQGFTGSGVERLNDSIRTYVWAIIGAQAQTRSGILGSRASFDAQRQLQANIEDTISSPIDIPSAIEKYPSVLQNASSKVDYAFGSGLYMASSDMRLHIGTIAGYNNEIVIGPVGQPLGVNVDVNSSTTPVLVETVVPQSPDDSEATAIPSESTPPAVVWHTT